MQHLVDKGLIVVAAASALAWAAEGRRPPATSLYDHLAGSGQAPDDLRAVVETVAASAEIAEPLGVDVDDDVVMIVRLRSARETRSPR